MNIVNTTNIVRIAPLSFCILLGNMYQPDYYDPRRDIRKWAENNIMKTWYMRTIYVSFKSEQDAIMFALRWC